MTDKVRYAAERGPTSAVTTYAHNEDTSSDPALAALGNEQFLSLTTFRKSSERVSTPMWVGRDGDALIMFTPEASGKVKRLRNNPCVELRPCNRLGRVKDGVEPIVGMTKILTDKESRARGTEIIRRKYGLGYRLVMGIERLIKSGQQKRVILRITHA